MKEFLYLLLKEKNINADNNRFNLLYEAGVENISKKMEYYYDKPYSCKSVVRKLFEEGVLKELQK